MLSRVRNVESFTMAFLTLRSSSLPADQPAEYDAIFGAFQQKLAELQQEMERQVILLDETENGAKQAWLAYREAA